MGIDSYFNHLIRLKVAHYLFLLCFTVFFLNQATAQRLAFRDSVPTLIDCNYFVSKIGVGGMSLRDENLSPLFYEGVNANLGLGYEWYKPKWFHEVSLLVDYGVLSSKQPKNSLPTSNNITHSIGIQFSTTHLWRTPWIPSEKWELELGGVFKSSPYAKINPSLFNNTFSAHYFMNLMGTAKISFDLTRNNSYYKNTKKGKEKLKRAVQRKLNFQFDFGVLNFSFLPGYTNVYMPEYGDDMKTAQGMFKEYRFKMNGWRFDFKLEYLHLFSTGNGHRLSLVTSVMHTPGIYRPLDFGATFLQYTMMINQKK